MAYVNNSVYWVGSNGQVYLKGPDGSVQNLGNATTDNTNLSAGGFESNTLKQSIGATQIADPNAPAPASGGGTQYQDKSNDIAVQSAGLGAADTQRAAGLSAVDKALGGLLGQYDTESGANHADYTKQSNTNNQNLQTNKESALTNAAQGRQGLFGTLASLGALNGSGIDLANRAVQQGANQDLSGAENNFGQNQTTLNGAIGKFEQEDARRRQDANSAATGAKAKVEHDVAASKQNFLTNLANDYAAEGNAGAAKTYSDQAASLYPTVANNSIPDTTNLSAESASFTPGSLGNYLAGNGDTTVTATPNAGGGSGRNALPGLLAANDARKKLVTA